MKFLFSVAAMGTILASLANAPGAIAQEKQPTASPTTGPVTNNNRREILTQAEFDQLFKQISNWGRWGKDDQLGTLNLITPARRREAAALVHEGISVSLARDLN